MKTITITGVTYNSGTGAISITGTVADSTFDQPAQRQTVNFRNANNTQWTRNLQVTDKGVFVLRTGANTAALLAVGLAQIAATLEPTLTWLPRFSTQPPNTSVAAGANATITSVQDVTDELTATFQWQRSTDGSSWVNITAATTPNDGCTYSNYTTAALTITNAQAAQNGYQYRVVATISGQSSSTTSNVAVLTVT